MEEEIDEEEKKKEKEEKEEEEAKKSKISQSTTNNVLNNEENVVPSNAMEIEEITQNFNSGGNVIDLTNTTTTTTTGEGGEGQDISEVPMVLDTNSDVGIQNFFSSIFLKFLLSRFKKFVGIIGLVK